MLLDELFNRQVDLIEADFLAEQQLNELEQDLIESPQNVLLCLITAVENNDFSTKQALLYLAIKEYLKYESDEVTAKSCRDILGTITFNKKQPANHAFNISNRQSILDDLIALQRKLNDE